MLIKEMNALDSTKMNVQLEAQSNTIKFQTSKHLIKRRVRNIQKLFISAF